MPVLGLVYGLGLGVHGRGGRVFREGSEGVVHAGLAVLARGVRILLRGTTPPRRLLPSHRHSVCRLALREGVRHAVHLPLPEGLLGYRRRP
jgi:hypothetical protein